MAIGCGGVGILFERSLVRRNGTRWQRRTLHYEPLETSCLLAASDFDLTFGAGGTRTTSFAATDDFADMALSSGGTTAHDAHDLALLALLDEWDSVRSYADRLQNLSGDGRAARLNGPYFLTKSTVHDDKQVDLLIGERDRDWFFALLGSSKADQLIRQNKDTITEMD